MAEELEARSAVHLPHDPLRLYVESDLSRSWSAILSVGGGIPGLDGRVRCFLLGCCPWRRPGGELGCPLSDPLVRILRQGKEQLLELRIRSLWEKAAHERGMEMVELLVVGAGYRQGDQADCMDVAAIQQSLACCVGHRSVLRIEQEALQAV